MLYRKILVVDDDEEILQLMEKKLVAQGYQVIRAQLGMEAVEKARSQSPDLILMDIVLPDIDGSEAVKLIQQDPITKNIPVIFVSGILTKGEEGKSFLDIKVAGQQYQAFAKPFIFQSLLNEIQEALGEID